MSVVRKALIYESSDTQFNILFLPKEILHKILLYISYDETSNCRMVCREFDAVCQQHLNLGFNRVNKLHSVIQKEVKSKLPRRESERRNHSLARHVDILSAVETRLSLLSMTYSKYMDIGACCFIPGKVLDEMFKVLHQIRNHPNPPRTHELLQELRDISSMAMEHFDEKVVPHLKDSISSSSELRIVLAGGSNPSSPSSTFSGNTLCNLMSLKTRNMIRRRLSPAKGGASSLSLNNLQKRLTKQDKEISKMKKQINETNRKLIETNGKLVEEERRRAELDRRIIDYDQQFVDIMKKIGCVRSSGDDINEEVGSKKPKKLNKQTTGEKKTPNPADIVSKTVNKRKRSNKGKKSAAQSNIDTGAEQKIVTQKGRVKKSGLTEIISKETDKQTVARKRKLQEDVQDACGSDLAPRRKKKDNREEIDPSISRIGSSRSGSSKRCQQL